MKNQEFLRAPFYVVFVNGVYFLYEYNRSEEFRVTLRASDYESIGSYQIFRVVGNAFYIFYYDRKKGVLIEVDSASRYKVSGECVLYQKSLESAGDNWHLWGILGSQSIGLPFGDPQYHCYLDNDVLSFLTLAGEVERHRCSEVSLVDDVPHFKLLNNQQMKLEIIPAQEDWDQNSVKAVEVI